MADRRPRRPTGIPRRELDRSKRFVIAYVRTRWEVIGEHRGPVAPWGGPDAATGPQATESRGPGGRAGAPRRSGPRAARESLGTPGHLTESDPG